MLQCSSAPVVFLLGSFFPSAFYAEIRGARAPEQLVLSQDPAVGFFWVTGTLTNSRLMLDEKYNLHCWLSPVTDTWQGFGWNFVLKILAWKLILHFVDIPGKAEPALPALQCVLTNRNISWNKSPCPPSSWGSPRLPTGAPVGVMEFFSWCTQSFTLSVAQGVLTSVPILVQAFNHRAVLGSFGILWLITRACFCLSFPGF